MIVRIGPRLCQTDVCDLTEARSLDDASPFQACANREPRGEGPHATPVRWATSAPVKTRLSGVNVRTHGDRPRRPRSERRRHGHHARAPSAAPHVHVSEGVRGPATSRETGIGFHLPLDEGGVTRSLAPDDFAHNGAGFRGINHCSAPRRRHRRRRAAHHANAISASALALRPSRDLSTRHEQPSASSGPSPAVWAPGVVTG